MNVLEKILEEIMQYTKDVYECDLGDIVEYQRRNREDKCTYIVQGIEEATEFIRSHMDDEEHDGWIPVEERLPEDGMYLCTLDGELCGIEETFTGMCGIENGIWDEPDCVIAWQPLPEPYKPKKDNLATEHIMSRFMKVE